MNPPVMSEGDGFRNELPQRVDEDNMKFAQSSCLVMARDRVQAPGGEDTGFCGIFRHFVVAFPQLKTETV